MVPRFFQQPKTSFFLFGPRGTGKSTWLRNQYPMSLYVDLLEPENFQKFLTHPEHLRSLIEGNPGKKPVIIDEIQKVPGLLGLIHLLIEENKNLQFILTGSSSRKLKRQGVDMLAGRALLRSMHPFMASELGIAFNLENALKTGLIPIVFDSPAPMDVLKTYTALYVREEVQMEGLVRNVGNFSRFLEAVSFSHASIINVANIARECSVERKVVHGYMEIMEDLLLSFRLPVFTKKAKRATSDHDKFFLFDAGVYRSLRPTGPLERPEEIQGSALEGLIAQHLRAWCAYRGRDNALYFWRTRKGVEVDFIIYGDDGFYAIEVKNTARVRPQDLRGLKAFHEDYHGCVPVLLYRGREKLKIEGIWWVPCADFLANLHPAKAIEI